MFPCHNVIVFSLVGVFVRRIVFAQLQSGGVVAISPILGIAQALMSVLGACRALRSFAGASCFTPSAGQATVSQEEEGAVSMMCLFVCCVGTGRGDIWRSCLFATITPTDKRQTTHGQKSSHDENGTVDLRRIDSAPLGRRLALVMDKANRARRGT